jgi:hypothetical protein
LSYGGLSKIGGGICLEGALSRELIWSVFLHVSSC